MTTQQLFEQLTSLIPTAMQHLHVPGVAIGLIYGDQQFSAGFGVTNLENPLPVNAETLFQVGSITKTVTATAMMRLVERGLVDLDTPIRTYLPDLRLADSSVAEQVTLRHIFTHTAGWMGDFFDDAGLGDYALDIVVKRMDRLPQVTPLGEIWSYNNAGYYLAGRVIEVVTGKTYEDAARELVLEPLGMSTSFFFAQDAITYRVAAGHDAVYPGDERQPAVLRPWWLARVSNNLGGLAAPVSDMMRYARFHMGDGKADGHTGAQLLKPESLSAMQTPTVPAANGEFMGVSWFLRDVVDQLRVVRHGGATNGQQATLQMVPARQFAIVMLTNSDRGGELIRPVVKQAFESFLGIVEHEPEPIPASEAQLSQYAGRYEGAAEDLQLEMSAGALTLTVIPKGGFPTPDSPPQPAPPPTKLALCGPDRVLALDEPFSGDQAEFLRTADGKLAWLRFGSRVHRLV
jgi:CubicO group peptidase (beta-lactamase class C family)